MKRIKKYWRIYHVLPGESVSVCAYEFYFGWRHGVTVFESEEEALACTRYLERVGLELMPGEKFEVVPWEPEIYEEAGLFDALDSDTV